MFTVRNLVIIIIEKASGFKWFLHFTVKKNNRVS